MKVKWNGREVEISPTIEALLKKRGWTFPPTEEMKREWQEAMDRSAGSMHTDPEVLEMIWEEERPSWWCKLKEEDPDGYRRWKEEATERYQRWNRQEEPRKERSHAR